MALTLADADRAIDAARQAGVPLQVGFNRRYDTGFRAAHDTIDRGRHRHAAAAALAHPRPRAGRPGPDPAVDDLHRDAHPRLRRAALPQPRRRARRGVRPGRRADPARFQGPRACSTPRS